MSTLFDEAARAHTEGRLEDALALSQQLLSLRPDDLDGSLLAGVVAAKLGRLDEALDRLSFAANRDPSSFPAAYWLSVAFRRLGNPTEAASAALQAAELKANDGEAQHQLGLCLMDLEDWVSAEVHLRAAATLAPQVASTQFNLGYALEELGRPAEARRAYRRAIALNPRHAMALNQLGQSLVNDLDYQGAMGCAKQILEIDPESFAGRSLMANTLLGLNRPADAFDYATSALAGKSDDPDALSLYGCILQALGRLDEGRLAFAKAIELNPLQGYAYYGLVRTHKLTDADLVQRMESVRADPALPRRRRIEVEFALGKSYADLGDPKAAMRHYDAANRLAREIRFGGEPFNRSAYAASTDYVVSHFTSAFFDANTRRGLPSEVPIIIVGMMRSGTTLAEQILSCHRDIGASGEQRFWADHRGSSSKPPDVDRIESSAEIYLALIKRSAPGKERVVDKMPGNYRYLGPIRVAFPNARIIHMRRNAVDTCLSIWMTPNGSNVEWGNDKRSVVFAYREYLRLMDHWRDLLPADRFMEFNYESLVTEFEVETKRMVEFCGLPWDDRCLRPQDNDRPVSTPSDWQVRQPIYRSAVDRRRGYEPYLGEFADLVGL